MRKLFAFLLILLTLCGTLWVQAYPGDLFVDEAELMNGTKGAELETYLSEISDEYDTAVMIVTVPDTKGVRIEDYARSCFGSNPYRDGEDRHNGILLLIALETRDWYIYTSGLGYDAFYEAGILAFEEDGLDDLGAGDYEAAFYTFADLCASYLHDETSVPWLRNVLIAVGIGLVLALIVVTVMKGQLKSVRRQHHAGSYVTLGSFALRSQRDTFLYMTLHRVPRPKQNNSSGSHGGGGGRSGGRGGRF